MAKNVVKDMLERFVEIISITEEDLNMAYADCLRIVLEHFDDAHKAWMAKYIKRTVINQEVRTAEIIAEPDGYTLILGLEWIRPHLVSTKVKPDTIRLWMLAHELSHPLRGDLLLKYEGHENTTWYTACGIATDIQINEQLGCSFGGYDAKYLARLKNPPRWDIPARELAKNIYARLRKRHGRGILIEDESPEETKKTEDMVVRAAFDGQHLRLAKKVSIGAPINALILGSKLVKKLLGK